MTDQRPLAKKQYLGWSAVRTTLPFVVGGACLWLVATRLTSEALVGLGPALATIAPHQWLLSLCATLLSFWALGRYDIVVHRHFRTQVSARHAGISGAAAIALAQVLGFGAVIGALVRWRMLPGLSPGGAVQISICVALSFFAGLAVCIVGLGLVLRPGILPLGLIIAGAFALCALVFLLLRHPVITVFGYRLRAPSLGAMVQIAGLTAIDTSAAALALFVLLPAGTPLGFEPVLCAYLLALGAALISGTPGG